MRIVIPTLTAGDYLVFMGTKFAPTPRTAWQPSPWRRLRFGSSMLAGMGYITDVGINLADVPDGLVTIPKVPVRVVISMLVAMGYIRAVGIMAAYVLNGLATISRVPSAA